MNTFVTSIIKYMIKLWLNICWRDMNTIHFFLVLLKSIPNNLISFIKHGNKWNPLNMWILQHLMIHLCSYLAINHPPNATSLHNHNNLLFLLGRLALKFPQPTFPCNSTFYRIIETLFLIKRVLLFNILSVHDSQFYHSIKCLYNCKLINTFLWNQNFAQQLEILSTFYHFYLIVGYWKFVNIGRFYIYYLILFVRYLLRLAFALQFLPLFIFDYFIYHFFYIIYVIIYWL